MVDVNVSRAVCFSWSENRALNQISNLGHPRGKDLWSFGCLSLKCVQCIHATLLNYALSYLFRSTRTIRKNPYENSRGTLVVSNNNSRLKRTNERTPNLFTFTRITPLATMKRCGVHGCLFFDSGVRGHFSGRAIPPRTFSPDASDALLAK